MKPLRANVPFLLNFSLVPGFCVTRLSPAMKLITINYPCSNNSSNVEITRGYSQMRTNNGNVSRDLWETWSEKYKKYHEFRLVL